MSILGEPDCERMQRGLQWIRQIRIPFKNCPTKNWFNVQRVFVPIAATMFQKHQRSHRRRVWLTASYGSVCPDMYGHHHRRLVARCVLWPAGQWHISSCHPPFAVRHRIVCDRDRTERVHARLNCEEGRVRLFWGPSCVQSP